MNAAQEFSRLSGVFYSEGTYRPSSGDRRTDALDPATVKVIGEFPTVTAEEIDQVAAANPAQKAWWAASALHRAEQLHEAAPGVDRLAPQVAELLTRETGKPYKESRDEMRWSVSATDYYAGLGRHSAGSVLGPSVAGQIHSTLEEPMGVVVVILPANFPVLLLVWEAPAALAAGCSTTRQPQPRPGG
jgi:betaine-aldehyde dehydrogenase